VSPLHKGGGALPAQGGSGYDLGPIIVLVQEREVVDAAEDSGKVLVTRSEDMAGVQMTGFWGTSPTADRYKAQNRPACQCMLGCTSCRLAYREHS
jgi:hypothetical protein